MASLVRSESFSSSSNPESPASPVSIKTETIISEQDLDFDSKTYANELLEHGLKEERFRIDRKKLEDMLQVHQSNHFFIWTFALGFFFYRKGEKIT